MDIEGKDISFNLTGVEPEEKILTDIIQEKLLRRDKDNKIKNEINNLLYKELDKNDDYNKVKNSLIKLTKEKLDKNEKDEKIKNLKNYLENIEKYYTKNIILNKKYLNYSDKYEIFNEIKNNSDINLIRIGSENKRFINPYSNFGIFGNHRYDFIRCIQNEDNLFFHLWNPHGHNPDLNNNNYDSKFEEINNINLEGLKNGNIILNFDRFCLSFRRIVYQKKKDIRKIYNKFKTKDLFDVFGIVERYFFFHLFGFTFEFAISLLWLRIFLNKGKDDKNIFFDLMNEIGSNKEISREQILWFFYIWNRIKNEMIKESEKIMNNKINNIYEKDLEKIMNILYEENENSNKYLSPMFKSQSKFLKEKLNETRKELEPFIRKLIEENMEKRRKEEEEEGRREEERRRRREEEYEEEQRRRRQR